MGTGSFDPTAYATYAGTVRGASVHATFTKTSLAKALDPHGLIVRESRDSADSPEATPLMVALDVTGSMGDIAQKMASEGLGVLFTEVLERKPITNPHLMFMGVGDVACDRTPFQLSQFEADNRIVDQLKDLYVEGGGGGNNTESYNVPWYVAAFKTSTDAFEKRGKKGYLFTIGDECAPTPLTEEQIRSIFGDEAPVGIDNETLLATAQRMWHVFHIVVEQGSYYRNHEPARVLSTWSALLGQHVLQLSDYTKLSEVIVSTMQIIEGEDAAAVAASWGGATASVVASATRSLAVKSTDAVAGAAGKAGIARF